MRTIGRGARETGTKRTVALPMVRQKAQGSIPWQGTVMVRRQARTRAHHGNKGTEGRNVMTDGVVGVVYLIGLIWLVAWLVLS